MTDVRVGLGFDVHAREIDRTLLLGGVEFPGEPGLAGHSDGDVVCHAIADALLGAAGLGDIGEHFPDSDPRVAGIPGPVLLARTVELVAAGGFRPGSCDVTVIAERPSIAPRRDDIRTALAETLGLDHGRVSVKASRPEGLGLSGDGAGCLAIVTLQGA